MCPSTFGNSGRTYLQVSVLVKAPPIRGPITDEIPKTMPNMLWNIGRLGSGIIGIMIIMAPEKMPALPKPAMARPKINKGEVGAAPHMAEPTSKITTEVKNVLLRVVSGLQMVAVFRRDVPFHIIELEQTAKKELRGRCCQHVGGAIPANVPLTVIFIRDLRYCGCDNGAVQGNKEDSQEVG